MMLKKNSQIIKSILLASFVSVYVIFSFNAHSSDTASSDTQPQVISNPRFEKLKNILFDQPYQQLPQYKVKRRSFGPSNDSNKNHLLTAANRTFESSSDLIVQPNGQKLLNANGICFSGSWHITEDNVYTGLYKKGTVSPVIIRASVAFSGTKQKNKRAFGMAIKLLPQDIGDTPSLNAFVLHSMGGTITKHVLDLSMDNQPPLGNLPRLSDLSTALRLRRDLEKADRNFGAVKPDASFRPVSDFANYKQAEKSAHSPKWLRLTPITQKRVDLNDFRDELRIENYPDKRIVFSIDVAGDDSSSNNNKKSIKWKSIGEIQLNESVTSLTCDLNLHFQHPKLKQ